MDIEWDKQPKWLNEEKIYGLACAELSNDKQQMVLQALSSTSSGELKTIGLSNNGFFFSNPHSFFCGVILKDLFLFMMQLIHNNLEHGCIEMCYGMGSIERPLVSWLD